MGYTAPSLESGSSTNSYSSSDLTPSAAPACATPLDPRGLFFFLLTVWYGLHAPVCPSLNMRVGKRWEGGVNSLQPSWAIVVEEPGQMTRTCSSFHFVCEDIVGSRGLKGEGEKRGDTRRLKSSRVDVPGRWCVATAPCNL